jgi:phosphatidylinositol alpha-mannosyltransferase
MRIGIVTQAYYPVLGGVTEHVWHLGRELERRGHAVTIITGGVPHRLLSLGTHGHDLNRGLRVLRHGIQFPLTMNGANMHVTWGWKLGRTLQRIEAEEQFDVVHIQSPTDPGLPLIASKSIRTPKVGTHHSFRDNHRFSDVIFRLAHGVFDDAVRKVQTHIAVSHSAASIIHRYYPDVPVTIVPNGIDTTRFSKFVQPIERKDDAVNILFVGRMDPRKGAKYLFAALPMLEQRLANYRITVVGTGWMQKYYDAHIPLTLRHRVVFAGYASPEELPRYYRSADMYCSPATGNESFGIVLLEAMACGTPVVASDIDGYRWVVNPGVEGLLVPPRSPEHLADAIATLANDPGLRRRMGEAGQVKAQQYDWARIVDLLEPIYEAAARVTAS